MSRRLVTLVGGLILAGCATSSGSQGSTHAPSSNPVENGPTTDWDHPFLSEGTTVSAESLASTPTAFGLRFTPTIPTFSSGRMRWTDLSRGGTVAFVLDFSGDPMFGADARVEVQESTATMTETEFAGVHWSGTHSMTQYGSTAIVLKQYNGVGDILFIKHGVLFEILGPALSPDAGLQLGEQLAAQVG
jgi:hypothetical protein